jgi:hypothetical protein
MVVLRVVDDPYAVVVPYWTWVSDASFVVQVTVAPLEVMFVACTAVIVGAVVSVDVVVVKVKFCEVARLPAASLLFTR